jgi:ACR3 family arsenite transporter
LWHCWPARYSRLQFLLPAAAFFLTLGSFVSAGLSKPEATGIGRTVISLAWILVLYPALAMVALSVAGLEPAFAFGMLLAIVAPPIGSAAAISAMLEMRPRLALILSIAPTVVAPLTIPIGLALFGSPASTDLLSLIVRLSVIIGAAAAISAFVLRFRRKSLCFIPDATAAAGLSVVGLVLVGLLAAAHARLLYELDTGMFVTAMGGAFALNIVGCVIGSAAFAVWGRKEALTIGLVTGNRNVTLAWAIAGSALPPAAEAFVVAAVVPVLVLPLAVKSVLAVGRMGLFQRARRVGPAEAARDVAVVLAARACADPNPIRRSR